MTTVQICKADGFACCEVQEDLRCGDCPHWSAKTAPTQAQPVAFHKQASHINPDYRDGWNACHAAFIAKQGGAA